MSTILIYCLLATAVLAIIGIKNPRIMLQKYPAEIQAAVAPKTAIEKKQAVIYALLILLVMLGCPLLSAWLNYHQQHSTFIQAFGYIWTLMFIFNLYDLLILDWLIFCTITPKFIVIKGSKGNKGYKNYRFHFIGFLKGIVITFLLSLVLAGILLSVK